MKGDTWMWRIDWLLVGAALGLVVVGVCAIDAATESAPGAGAAQRQLAWTTIALAAMGLVMLPSYRLIEAAAYGAFGVCLPLLIAVYWTEPVNGAQRWLRVGPVGVQPSELAKLAFVAALARYLMHKRRRLRDLVPAILLAALPMVLILKQPDLGTSLVFVPVLMAMLFCAGVRRRTMVTLIVAGAIALPGLWMGMSTAQRSRITSFLDQRDTGPKPRGDGYQLYQSKLMIALGGPYGADDAVDLHLPFAHTDFVFSVIAGRWGLVGVTGTLLLCGIVLWRGFGVAARSQEPFGQLMAVGIVTMLATQGFVNMAMTVGLAPITGLTLPFVSYGGSSLLTSFLAVGILLNVGLGDRPAL